MPVRPRPPRHDANDNCAVAVKHYENFPVASMLCPPGLRAPITSIYRFARTADDIADEGEHSAQARRQELRDYATELNNTVNGLAPRRWPEVFNPLHECIVGHRLPVALLHDLLDAFMQDCDNPCYTTRDELLHYCRRSANPIGRLLLHLYGVSDSLALRQSDAICSALQLINFWQDPSVDLPRGRNYFPAQDLQGHGLAHTDLHAGQDSPATRALVRDLSAWAHGLMLEGAPLAQRLPGRIGWELGLVVQGGMRILAKIDTMNHATFSSRPRLWPPDFPGMLWRVAKLRLAMATGIAR